MSQGVLKTVGTLVIGAVLTIVTEIVAKKALGGRCGRQWLIDLWQCLSRRCHDSPSLRRTSHKRCSEEGIFLGEARFWHESFGRRGRSGGDVGCKGGG